MTTIANKHGLRAAATERRTRHAQRTPLPPRAGQVEAAKDGEPPVGDRYGKMTVSQLRTRAEELGLKPPKSANKGKLLDAILAAERAAYYEAAQAEQDQIPQDDDAPSGAWYPEEPKGVAKAERMTTEMRSSGWETTITSGPDGRTTAVATRGPEVITIAWDTGVFNYEDSSYLVGDRKVKPRNVSQARAWARRPAEDATAELARVTANRAFKRREPKDATAPTAALPFDPSNATAQEVWSAIVGKKLTWYNRHARSTESATVSPNGRGHFRLQQVGGEYVIQFTGIDGKIKGFRACRLSDIRRIGR